MRYYYTSDDVIKLNERIGDVIIFDESTLMLLTPIFALASYVIITFLKDIIKDFSAILKLVFSLLKLIFERLIKLLKKETYPLFFDNPNYLVLLLATLLNLYLRLEILGFP